MGRPRPSSGSAARLIHPASATTALRTPRPAGYGGASAAPGRAARGLMGAVVPRGRRRGGGGAAEGRPGAAPAPERGGRAGDGSLTDAVPCRASGLLQPRCPRCLRAGARPLQGLPVAPRGVAAARRFSGDSGTDPSAHGLPVCPAGPGNGVIYRHYFRDPDCEGVVSGGRRWWPGSPAGEPGHRLERALAEQLSPCGFMRRANSVK